MATEIAPAAAKPASPYSRTNPFPGKLTVNRSLCGEGSEKDTRHFEIDLSGWGLNYEVGDSMTVWATNDPVLVDAILKAICANRATRRRAGAGGVCIGWKMFWSATASS